jgi:hypothetical protein
MSQLNVTAWFSLQAGWELIVTAECHSLVLSASVMGSWMSQPGLLCKPGGNLSVTAERHSLVCLLAWGELNVTAGCHSLVLSACLVGS